jgi:SH3-like domain-containing protein
MRRHYAIGLGIGLVIFLVLGMWHYQQNRASAAETRHELAEQVAQGGASSTPIPVILPSGTATNLPSTETPTRTPTSAGPALVEAKSPDTNVRVGPGIENDRIGQIQPGTQFVVRGRRFEWFRIDFPDAPSGIGWVHESVVNVIGDVSQIPELSEAELPTPDLTAAAREETQIAATQTPGGLLTLTAEAFITPQGIFTQTPQIGAQPTLAPGERLPTFTFPPFTPTPLAIQALRQPVAVADESGGIAPIFIVVGLGGLGIMGLLVSLLRRF